MTRKTGEEQNRPGRLRSDAGQTRAGARGGHGQHTDAALQALAMPGGLRSRGTTTDMSLKSSSVPTWARQAPGEVNQEVSRREVGRGAHTQQLSGSLCS